MQTFLSAPLVSNALRENNVSAPLANTLTALTSTFAAGLTGKAAGASAAFNEVANNYLPHAERLLLNESINNCYTQGNASACETARVLNKKDQLSNRLLVNAVATCKGTECNEVSNYIQSQLHEMGCPVPSVCQDAGPLYKYWAITQKKAQGDMKVYPELWLLDAKAVLELGQFGIKVLRQAGHPTGASESLQALEKLTATKKLPRTGTRGDIYTSSSIGKPELNMLADDAMQYTQYQSISKWIYPRNFGFTGEITKKTLLPGTKLDRLGDPSGSYLAPSGTAYEARALAPGSGASKFYSYEVIKPLPVIEGKTAPAFGQTGGGLQILPDLGFHANIQWLLDNAYIRIVK